MKQIEALTQILPYVRAFQGKTFVVKLGGEVCTGEALRDIAEQVSLSHHIGIRMILVHGGGPQLDELLEQLSIPPVKKAGRRITDDATLRAATMVFAGQVSTEIVAALCTHGACAVGLSGVDGHFVKAARRPPLRIATANGGTELIDFQNVGVIEEIDTTLLDSFARERIVPVISPLAADEDGRILNINADTMASKLAQALKAEKLIVMSNVAGILRSKSDPTSLISYTDIAQIEQLIEDGKITDGMLPKVQACMDALKNGVKRTHIIDGSRPSSLLLELFLNEGVGTMIVEKLEQAG